MASALRPAAPDAAQSGSLSEPLGAPAAGAVWRGVSNSASSGRDCVCISGGDGISGGDCTSGDNCTSRDNCIGIGIGIGDGISGGVGIGDGIGGGACISDAEVTESAPWDWG